MLAAVVLLAALLRLAWLGRMSLWMDEGFTLFVASAPWGRLGSTGVALDWHPLGYYICAKLGLLAMPSAEWGLRIPAALCGIATVAAFYPLAKEMSPGASSSVKPLAATGLCATLAMLVLANRDGRSYSAAILGLTLATLAWTRALRTAEPEKGRWWMVWVVTGLAAIYCHYYALVVLAWEWLVAVSSQPRVKRWWVTPPIVFVAYLPALLRLKQQIFLPRRGHPPPRWEDVVDVFFVQTAGFTLNFPSIWVWYGLALCGLVGAAAGCLSAVRDPRRIAVRRIGMVYWGFAATLLGVPAVSAAGVFESKHFVLASPLYVLLMTEAIFTLPWRSLRATLMAGLILLNLTSALNAIMLPEWHRQDFRGAIEVVARNARPGDILVMDPDIVAPVVEHYLGQRRASLTLVPLSPEASASFRSESLPAGASEQRVWVVQGALATYNGPLLPELSKNRRQLMHWKSHRRSPLQEVELYLYSTPSGGSP